MQQSELHIEARRLASQGVPVFPCIRDTKRPATENGFHDASTDLNVIDAWWSADPQYNIAFSPHTVGLAVIDLDGGQDGEDAWQAWQDANVQCPKTYTVRTPRGGRHLYYRGILPGTVGKLGEHVDTRGVGSYALVPPSLVGGKPYLLEDARAAADLPPEVPAWLEALKREHVKATVDGLDLPANVARAERLLHDYVKRENVAVEGHMGNQKTFVTACEVMNLGLSQDRALDLIAEIWNPACIPPWEDDELTVVVENAARYAQNEAGAWAVETSEETFGEALDKLALDPPEPPPPETPKRRRFKFYSPAELEGLPAPSFLIPDLIPDQGIAMLYGPPGSFKSFAAVTWSLELASLGIPVAYVAGEGYVGINQRATAWRTAHGVPASIPFFVSKQAPAADDGDESLEFLKELETLHPALVVIDTLARASGGLNENDARDMNQFVRFLDKVRDVLHCAVLVIHHTGKDDARGARGSNALTGATDAAFEAKGDPKTKALAIWVRRQKDAEARQAPFTYEGKDVGGQLVFQPISSGEYEALTKIQDRLKPAEIGGLLRELGAVGEEDGVTTHILAYELVSRAAGEAEDQDAMVRRQVKVLAKMSKTSLEAYCTGYGTELRWFLP